MRKTNATTPPEMDVTNSLLKKKKNLLVQGFIFRCCAKDNNYGPMVKKTNQSCTRTPRTLYMWFFQCMVCLRDDCGKIHYQI